MYDILYMIQDIDPFVIYQERYTNLRDAINTAVYEGDVTDLTQGFQVVA